MLSRQTVLLGLGSLLLACGSAQNPENGAQDAQPGGPDDGASSGEDDAGETSEGDETGGAEDTGETGAAGEAGEGDEQRYTIRGRAELGGAEAPARALGLTSAAGPMAEQEGCPFAPGSAPCVDEACTETPDSEACKAVVEEHCEMKPDDRGCPQSEGGDGDGGAGEEWVCDVQPDWPPCEVCVDPEQPEDACPNAWNEHCNENPGDPWCGGPDDGGPDDGGPDDGGPDDGGGPEAVFPIASLSLLVHRVEFSLDAENCSDPILVAEHETPALVDFASHPKLLEALPPPEGTYPCVIITMSDNIQWSVEGDNECAGTAVQDVHGEDGDGEETVQLFISTAGYGGSDGDHGSAFEAPGILLDAPLETGSDVAGSTFVVGFPEGVHLYRDGETIRCNAQKPSFTFETIYE